MPKKSKANFFTLLKKEIEGIGNNWKIHQTDTRFSIETFDYTGLQATIELENNKLSFHFYHRTSSWYLDGCGGRTDIHEVISTLFVTFLKRNSDISCAVYNVPHPAVDIPGEVYARYIFPIQADNNFYNLTDNTLKLYKQLAINISLFEHFLWNTVGCPCPDCRKELNAPYEYAEEIEENQFKNIIDAMASKEENALFVTRYLPTWIYYNDYKQHISLVYSPELCRLMRIAVKPDIKVSSLKGIKGELVDTLNTQNFINARNKNKNHKILSKLKEADKLPILDIQLENLLCSFSSEYFLISSSLGNESLYLKEKQAIQERHSSESEFLYPFTKFTWFEKIDAGNFEELIKDLLEKEPGVTWVRKVADVYEPDGGRDLICEWRIAKAAQSLNPESIDEDAYFPIKVIVQCKAYKDGVSKSDVTDITDLIEHHSYQGYFLATSSYTKRSLTDFLDRLKTSGKYFINWWTRDEIEKRLVIHEDILSKYKSIVTRSFV